MVSRVIAANEPGRPGAAARMVCAVLCAALLVPLFPGDALAEKYTAGRKFARGLAAVTCGFLEIPGNMVKETRRSGAATGFTLGFVEGLGRLVVRELVGVYEIITAPADVPKGFRPVIKPEFPWEYFDEPAPKRKRR